MITVNAFSFNLVSKLSEYDILKTLQKEFNRQKANMSANKLLINMVIKWGSQANILWYPQFILKTREKECSTKIKIKLEKYEHKLSRVYHKNLHVSPNMFGIKFKNIGNDKIF